jgi:Na+-transporting NADH:ubiquinone oxidoreductase subunit NqrE
VNCAIFGGVSFMVQRDYNFTESVRTALANQRVKRSDLTTEAMQSVVKALAG